MKPTKKAPAKSSSTIFKIARVLLILLVLIFITFLVVSFVSGTMGAVLLFVPSVLFGILSVVLVFRRPSKALFIALPILLFFITGGYAFHIMFKFIQPTVLPKHAVAIGNPWVIEGNVFTNNDYTNPVVLKMDDGTYRMYFHDHDNMETAVSNDGKKFSDVTKLFQGQMPTVVRTDSGDLRMYYFVNADAPPNNQPPAQGGQPQPAPHPQTNCGDNCHASKHNLVSATSSDGLHWTQEPGVRLDSTPNPNGYDRDTMIHPSVIRLTDGSYKLYYDGEVDPTSSLALVSHYRKIMSASSKDGLTWTKDPGYCIDEKPVHTWEAYSPKAVYQNGQVILRFTTPNGIYQATSTDATNFIISKNPIFTPGRVPMPTDEGASRSYQDAYVLPVDGGNRMYFWIAGQGLFSAFQKT